MKYPPPKPDSYLITLASTLRGQTKECTALISFYYFFFNSLFFFLKKAVCMKRYFLYVKVTKQ